MRIELRRKGRTVFMKCIGDIPDDEFKFNICDGIVSDFDYRCQPFFDVQKKIYFGGYDSSFSFVTEEDAKISMKRTEEAARELIKRRGKQCQ